MKKILVEHEVPYEKGHEGECVYSAAEGSGGSYSPCKFLTWRNRGGRGRPANSQPKCRLFERWLDRGRHCEKCPECLELCQQSDG